MSMTIGEASAVATVLKAVAQDLSVLDRENVLDALRFLNERAGKSLQLSRIVTDDVWLEEGADLLLPPAVTS